MLLHLSARGKFLGGRVWLLQPGEGRSPDPRFSVGGDFAPRRHLALSADTVGHQWVWQPGMLLSTPRCTGQPLPPRILPPQMPMVQRFTNPGPDWLAPKKGKENIHQWKTGVQSTRPMSTLFRFPWTPLASSLSPAPRVSTSARVQLSSKDAAWAAGATCEVRELGNPEFTSHGWPCVEGGGGKFSSLASSSVPFTLQSSHGIRLRIGGPLLGNSSCPRPTSRLPYQVLLETLFFSYWGNTG